MKNTLILVGFPVLMLLFTLTIGSVERIYSLRRREKPAEDPTQPDVPLQQAYYYLPTVDGYRIDALNPERPLDRLANTESKKEPVSVTREIA